MRLAALVLRTLWRLLVIVDVIGMLLADEGGRVHRFATIRCGGSTVMVVRRCCGGHLVQSVEQLPIDGDRLAIGRRRLLLLLLWPADDAVTVGVCRRGG